MTKNQLHFLIVEDEPMMAILLKKLLGQLGYERISWVKSGEEAIAASQDTPFDLILMDINLEGELDGIQTAEIIQSKSEIPVIYATSYSDEETIQNAKSTLPIGYLLKPFNKEILKPTIEVALSIKELKSKKNAEIRAAYDKINLQQKELMQSLRSAIDIQQSVLPKMSKLEQFLRSSMILNLPKDLIGGDFIWHSIINEDEALVGVVDCTGHGVPGALTSILVNNLLFKALGRVNHPSKVGEIMTLVNEYLLKEQRNFEEGLHSESVITGADAGLCYINKKTKKLIFSGAKRPLILVREGERLRYRGSRSSLGLYYLENKSFDETEIEVKTNDKLFLFSDGYPDQIGGENKKRMKRKAMESLLCDEQNLSGEEKSNYLLEAFIRWKGANEQLDDVTVLGFQV